MEVKLVQIDILAAEAILHPLPDIIAAAEQWCLRWAPDLLPSASALYW